MKIRVGYEPIDGRAYTPFYANNLDPEAGYSWTETTNGGGSGQIVLPGSISPTFELGSK